MPSPTLSGSMSATRSVMTPSASSRCNRFQQGVDDKPDALADFGDRERGVLLHDGEDLPVDGVHSLVPRILGMMHLCLAII